MKNFFLTLLFALTAMVANAQATFIVGTYSYRVLDADAKTVTMISAGSASSELVIPSTVRYNNEVYTVTQIDGYVFSGMEIRSVTIPATIDSIGERAFGECNYLYKVTVEDSPKPLKMVNGYYGTFAYSYGEKEIYLGRNLELPEVGNPFAEATKVTFGDLVTYINPHLFEYNPKLNEVKIGCGVTEIGEYAFEHAGDSSEEEIRVTLGDSLKTIGYAAFNSCENLKSIRIPESVKLIEGYAFSGSHITELTIPVAIDSLGERAFGENNYLSYVKIADSPKPLKMVNGYYGTFAYSLCEKDIYLGRDLELPEFNNPFAEATSVTFGDKVTHINPYLFQYNPKLKEVIIGTGVTEIGEYAFEHAGDEAENGIRVTLGNHVTKIGYCAFNSCEKLTSIRIPEVTTLIEGYAFSGAGIAEITIPASVDSLGERVFGECPSLALVKIADSPKPLKMVNGYYGTFAYSACEKEIYLGRNLELPEFNNPFAEATSVAFGWNVTYINPHLFQYNPKLANVIIGNGVTEIGEYAFEHAGDDQSVEELNVTLGNHVTKIGYGAFNSCEKLKSIRLPESLALIEGYAFSGSSLAEITIPAGIDSLGERIFGEDGYLTAVKIADSPKPLKLNNGYYGAFAYCPSITSVYWGRNIQITEGDQILFPTVQDITFGKEVTDIGYQASGVSVISVKAPWMQPIAIADEAFSQTTFMNATLWVPGGTKELYSLATGWKNFGDFREFSYRISIEAGEGGTVSVGDVTAASGQPAETTVDFGSDIVFQITPAEGYQLQTLTVNGVDVTAQVAGNQYAVRNVSESLVVKATFEACAQLIALTGTMVTYSSAMDLNFTGAEVKAYIAAGYNKTDNEVLLVRVYDVPAGTGLVLKGTAGQSYRLPFTTSHSYYVNLLKAQLTASEVSATTGDKSNFLLKLDTDGEYRFYAPDEATMLDGQQAYLQVPTEFITAPGRAVKVVFADEDTEDETSLARFELFNTATPVLFNLGGQQVKNAQKGILIEGNKKIYRK